MNICFKFEVGPETYQMATYEWIGQEHPLNAPKFYCFIEDWDRQKGAEGHLKCRSANFRNATILDWNGISHAATVENFTKVEGGEDKFACNKVKQEQCKTNCNTEIFMATGGAL